MTNFDVIKRMNIREMTGVFYSFIIPWTTAYTKEQKEDVWKQIEQFLMAERKEQGASND